MPNCMLPIECHHSSDLCFNDLEGHFCYSKHVCLIYLGKYRNTAKILKPPAPTVNGGGDCLWKWSNFRLSRTRDLDLDLGSGHTAYMNIHQSLTSNYVPNFIEIEETFCGRMDVRTDGRTFETGFIRSTWMSQPSFVALFCTFPISFVFRLIRAQDRVNIF